MSGLDETSHETPGSGPLDAAVRTARSLLDERSVRAARDVVQAALAAGQRNAELLWVQADIEFADGNLIAGCEYAAEAFDASGGHPAAIARRIRVLRRNFLWREALLVIENFPMPDDPLIRAEVGAFYRSCGCRAHAAQGYGPRRGLTGGARAIRRWCWLWSGGPSKALRDRLRGWEDAKLLPALRRWPSYLKLLDNAGLADRQVTRLRIQLDTMSYRLARLSYEFDAVLTAGYRLLPLSILPVWLVMLLVVSQAGFAAGIGAAAGAATVGSSIAVAVVTLLVFLLIKPNGEMRFGIPVPTYRAAGLYVFLTAVFEAAAGEGYDRRVLPNSGWWSWVVLGLIVTPAAIACLPMAAAVFAGLWQFRYVRIVHEDCVLFVLDLLLNLLEDLRCHDDDQGFSRRLLQARRLEYAARWLVGDLVPSTALGNRDSREWLRQKAAGWAQALRYAQRQVVAPVPGDKAKVEAFLVHEIQCLATSNLGALSWRKPPPPLSQRALLKRRIIAVVRTALVAGLPLAAVLTAQPLLHFNSTLFDWARVSAGIWALLYVILSLDPTISDKVGTARDIAGLLRGSPAPGSSSDRRGPTTSE